MFNFDITELGLGAVIALLILKEVFAFLKTRKESNFGNLKEIQIKIDEIYNWYGKIGTDNLKAWYVLKSLEKSINSLQEVIKEQNRTQQLSLDVLKEINYQLRHVDSKVNQIDRKIHKK